jgi:undecaprenyl-diphosphatase
VSLDETVLVFIHGHVPPALDGFFEAITFTGSFTVLLPLTLIAVLSLLWAGHRYEALLLGASVATGGAIIYAIKSAIDRARPELWDTAWYWGSSFPSGHTLATAAFATAAVICVVRIRSELCWYALSFAAGWIVLVGLSRLVIGVHWPTDVLGAACIGIFLPFAINLAIMRSRG